MGFLFLGSLDNRASTEKKLGQVWATCKGSSLCFYGQFKKHCSVRTKKLHIISLKKKFFCNFFWSQNRPKIKFSNLSVQHKGLLMEDWGSDIMNETLKKSKIANSISILSSKGALNSALRCRVGIRALFCNIWPVRQSRAPVEHNLSLSQNKPISWYIYRYTYLWHHLGHIRV